MWEEKWRGEGVSPPPPSWHGLTKNMECWHIIEQFYNMIRNLPHNRTIYFSEFPPLFHCMSSVGFTDPVPIAQRVCDWYRISARDILLVTTQVQSSRCEPTDQAPSCFEILPFKAAFYMKQWAGGSDSSAVVDLQHC